MLNKFVTCIVLVALLTGCSLIPHYHQPQAPIAETWPVGDSYPESDAGDTAQIAWQKYIQSVPLHQLINRVLDNNRDLKIAALNIEQGQGGVPDSAFRINADTDRQRQRQPRCAPGRYQP